MSVMHQTGSISALRPPVVFPFGLNFKFKNPTYTCHKCNRNYRKRKKPTTGRLIFAMGVALAVGSLITALVLFQRFPNRFQNKQSDVVEMASWGAATGGQLSTFEKLMVERPKSKMDNAAVLRLWKASVDQYVILQMIRESTADYDLTPNAVISLHEMKVDPAIILAMIEASHAKQ